MPPRIEPRLREFAETMRHEPTPFERIVWQQLRASRLDGLKFRRQSVIGDVIVDFYCPMAAMIVEIDGGTHDPEADFRRDAGLVARGFKVLRFSNHEVRENLDGVLRAIIAEGRLRCPTERPSPEVRDRGAAGVVMTADSPTPNPSLERQGGGLQPLARS